MYHRIDHFRRSEWLHDQNSVSIRSLTGKDIYINPGFNDLVFLNEKFLAFVGVASLAEKSDFYSDYMIKSENPWLEIKFESPRIVYLMVMEVESGLCVPFVSLTCNDTNARGHSTGTLAKMGDYLYIKTANDIFRLPTDKLLEDW